MWKIIFFLFQISEDDSYISDISDTISVDNLSNDLETDRSNSGKLKNFY